MASLEGYPSSNEALYGGPRPGDPGYTDPESERQTEYTTSPELLTDTPTEVSDSESERMGQIATQRDANRSGKPCKKRISSVQECPAFASARWPAIST
jgi:hypothetical protein